MIHDPVEFTRQERSHTAEELIANATKSLTAEAIKLQERQVAIQASKAAKTAKINAYFRELDGVVKIQTRLGALRDGLAEREALQAVIEPRVNATLCHPDYEVEGNRNMGEELGLREEIPIYRRVIALVEKELETALAEVAELGRKAGIPESEIPTATSRRFGNLIVPNPSPELLEASQPSPPRGGYQGVRDGRHTFATAN